MFNHDINDDELIEKAMRRYWRDAEAAGAVPEQPSQSSYVDDDGNVVLVNVRDVMARYRPSRDTVGRVRLQALEVDEDEDGDAS